MTETDDALDARIRAASHVPFDDVAVTEGVLARVHAARRRAPAPLNKGWIGWVGPAAFASILAATPFVVAFYPASQEDFLIGLAMGDPRAILGEAGFAGRGGVLE